MAKSAKTRALSGAALLASVKEGRGDEKTSFTVTMEFVDRALAGAKNLVQTIEKLEPILAAAELACLEHAMQHGDVTPADKLVKGLPNHPSMKTIQAEIVAWFRANSPIYWDAQGNPHQAKEGEPQFKEYAPEKAAEEAFYERPQAVKARTAAANAHKRALEPITFADMQKRVYGLRSWIKSALEPNNEGEVRGIKKGDKERMESAAETVISAFDAVASGKVVKIPASVKAADSKGGSRSAVVKAKAAGAADPKLVKDAA